MSVGAREERSGARGAMQPTTSMISSGIPRDARERDAQLHLQDCKSVAFLTLQALAERAITRLANQPKTALPTACVTAMALRRTSR